ncbi:MAG TPA: MYXO-CTERM sorting domain-containing protein, partial [Polyangiaceae bacterium]|nr:MYXO-CTERM sorting domain-containing protein [Polyangiaceae bacterium]
PTVPAPAPADPNNEGSLEGGGLSCATGAAGHAAPTGGLFGLAALLGFVARRRARARGRAA